MAKDHCIPDNVAGSRQPVDRETLYLLEVKTAGDLQGVDGQVDEYIAAYRKARRENEVV